MARWLLIFAGFVSRNRASITRVISRQKAGELPPSFPLRNQNDILDQEQCAFHTRSSGISPLWCSSRPAS
jgi:hypothetical protein